MKRPRRPAAAAAARALSAPAADRPAGRRQKRSDRRSHYWGARRPPRCVGVRRRGPRAGVSAPRAPTAGGARSRQWSCGTPSRCASVALWTRTRVVRSRQAGWDRARLLSNYHNEKMTSQGRRANCFYWVFNCNTTTDNALLLPEISTYFTVRDTKANSGMGLNTIYVFYLFIYVYL